MWFGFSLLALLFWSGSDLFSKIGCRSADDKLSHLKMVVAVGIVMGLHALWEVTHGVQITGEIIIRYLPVSALYIVSMAIGYVSLRYIELSVSSPICNSSGALVAILTVCTLIFSGEFKDVNATQLLAVAFVCIGAVFLGVAEHTENDELRKARQDKANFRYTKSALAIILPVLYCVLDALGTFADSLVLENMDEDSANVAYELTFLAVAAGIIVYMIIRTFVNMPQEKTPSDDKNSNAINTYFKTFIDINQISFRSEAPKFIGAAFETVGQFAYIHAIADTAHVMYAAPIIAAYCALSVVWGRIFLKERLSFAHYEAIIIMVLCIAVIGYFDM